MPRPWRRKLSGKVAIVTGASSGIGMMTARRLAEKGMRVCVTARSADLLEGLANDLRSRGLECLAVPADVTVHEDVRRVVEQCLATWGQIDLLVNDAAVQAYARFEDLSWREIERIVDVNLLGYFRFAREVLPHMRRRSSGHIINVLSVLSKTRLPMFSMYGATKHALLGWSETLRRELAGSGIEVSAVLMPGVATPLYDQVTTRLDWAPRPPPPVYSTAFAARAIVRCARRPRGTLSPSFVQGHLMVGAAHFLVRPADLFVRLFGMRIQQRRGVPAPAKSNLFEPGGARMGTEGTLRPTPDWVRWTLGALAVMALVPLAARRLAPNRGQATFLRKIAVRNLR